MRKLMVGGPVCPAQEALPAAPFTVAAAVDELRRLRGMQQTQPETLTRTDRRRLRVLARGLRSPLGPQAKLAQIYLALHARTLAGPSPCGRPSFVPASAAAPLKPPQRSGSKLREQRRHGPAQVAQNQESQARVAQLCGDVQAIEGVLAAEKKEWLAFVAAQKAEMLAFHRDLRAGLQRACDAGLQQAVAARLASQRAQAGAEEIVAEPNGMVRINVHGKTFPLHLKTLRHHADSVLAAVFSGDYHLPLDAAGAYRLQLPCSSEQFEHVVDFYHGHLAISFGEQEATRLQAVALRLGLPEMADMVRSRVDRSLHPLLHATLTAVQKAAEALQPRLPEPHVCQQRDGVEAHMRWLERQFDDPAELQLLDDAGPE